MSNSIAEVIQIALREHEPSSDLPPDVSAYTSSILDSLSSQRISTYNRASPALSLVSFQCMLQDTGYSMEVYLPDTDVGNMTNLRERWVGWGVEIPGLQRWAKEDNDLTSEAVSHPVAAHSKFPLPEKQKNYLGALIKVYGDVSFRPATLVDVVGILSTSMLPCGDSEDIVIVPTIHAIRIPEPTVLPTIGPLFDIPDIRSRLINHLASAFQPADPVAAELLLLNLISMPMARQAGQEALGTLSLNFISVCSTEMSSNIIQMVQDLMPMVVTLPLSVPLLHSSTFVPTSADSASLDSGMLQLGAGTVLAVQEGEMGEGGQLNEKAISNLKALIECLQTQTLRYAYPFMDTLRMDCAIRGLIFSEGKSLIPVDVAVPVSGQTSSAVATADDVALFRSYLANRSRVATEVDIPEDVAQTIQDDFVSSRQGPAQLTAEVAADRLKRRIRIARVLAQSYPEVRVTVGIWQKAVELEGEIESRLQARLKVS